MKADPRSLPLLARWDSLGFLEAPAEALYQDGGRCSYCSTPLDPSYTFCLRCAKPYKPTPRLLPSTPYLDTEVRIRTLAPQVGQLYLWYLFALIVPGTIAYALLGTPEAVGLVVQLAVIVPTAIFASIHSCALGSQLDLRKFFTPTLLAGLLLLPFAIGLNYAYHYIIYVYFDAPDVLGEMLENIPIEVRILMICILPAIVEEIGFRGLIQHWLQPAIGPWKAILMTSVLFSLIHFSLLSAPYLFLVGVYLGWLRWKSGSLYPCIIVHFLHNLAVVLIDSAS